MNKDKISDALNDLDEKYIEETLDYRPKVKKPIYMAIGGIAACLAVMCAVLPNARKVCFDSPTLVPQPINSTEPTTAEAPTDVPTEPATVDLHYSALVRPHELPENIDIEANSGASIDCDVLHCENLKECTAVIEGRVVDMYTKTYMFDTPFDKFEPDGVLHNRRDTVVYTVEVEKSFYGDIPEGATVTVEDEYFYCGPIISVCPDHTFVIPIVEYGEKMLTMDEPLSGDLTRDGIYCSWASIFPQIEAAEGGYIVDAGWEPIVEGCERVIMDAELSGMDEYYADRLYYVPEELFRERIAALLE